MLTLKYFASLRERLGREGEELGLPEGVATVGELTAWLQQRDAGWHSALADRNIRAAVNHEIVAPDAVIRDGDEIAWFPPVTGG